MNKKSNIRSMLSVITFAIVSYFVIIACANRGGGPQGGPKDVYPPKPLKTTPKPDAVNYTKNRIEIVFDEIVQIEKAFDNVVVSPPQTQAPIVKALGKKIIVELKDTLKDNTTYTVFFGDAIVDNNEKNPLSNYFFSFSTGDCIDTLQMSGIVIDAYNLNPVAGILVGIHSNLTDSVFEQKSFDRITRTDKNGKFTITNIKEGKYRIYALDDIGNNFKFDIPNEKLAYLDTVYTPYVEIKFHSDSIFKDSIVDYNGYKDTIKVLDTIVNKYNTLFLPDSIVLKVFKSKFKTQYLIKTERKERHKFTFYFNDINEDLPIVEALNFPFNNNTVITDANDAKDTVSYWIKDSLVWSIDTLMLKLTYLKTDSLGGLISQTDTVSLHYTYNRTQVRTPITKNFLRIKTNMSSAFNYFDTIVIAFDIPTIYDNRKNILIEYKKDTLWKQQKITLEKLDSIGLKYMIKTALKHSETYRIKIDSAFFRDIYGKVNDSFEKQIVCKSKDSYSSLTFEMGLFTGKEIVELIDKDEKIIRHIAVDREKIKFEYLDAGTYYARLFIDENGNGKWDTGDFRKKIQPEAVYYYPYSLQLRQMWDSEEYWDYLEIPVEEQKPQNLKDKLQKSGN